MRYRMAEAFNGNGLYYCCDCAGSFLLLRRAVLSALAGRRGTDAHDVSSSPVISSPYDESMTAVYGGHPNRFGAKDSFRMGNHTPPGFTRGNTALEFFPNAPRALISQSNLNNTRDSPDSGSNH
jgi:hypothetical protein